MERFDVVVIGGGPAGLAASLAAARAGLSALVADVRRPPIDRLCGEGILPEGLSALEELGVDLSGLRSADCHGISFQEGHAGFAATLPGRPGRGMRRTVLHGALLKAVEGAGVEVRWGVRAVVSGPHQVRIGEDSVEARYVVGADGQRSQVGAAAGLSASVQSNGRRKRQRLAAGRHYAVAPWSRMVEVYWSGRTQAYVTAVDTEEVSVAFISADPAVRIGDCLGLFPELSERLRRAEVVGKTQGQVSSMLRLRRVVRGEVALIGDASGCVDAITGEGLSLAFREALLLGEAFKAEDLGLYERGHAGILRRTRIMAELLLSLSEYPSWRRRVFGVFAAEPRAFQNLLSMHVGQAPRWFGAGGCTQLCTQLLFG